QAVSDYPFQALLKRTSAGPKHYNISVRRPMRIVKACLLLFVISACVTMFAQAGQKPGGFDMKAIDKTVDPCENFYQFACGSWIKNNPIPADQSRWGRFNELIERNNDVLREILDKAAKPSAGRNATDQKIGDFYGA